MRQSDSGIVTSSQRLMLPLDYLPVSQIAAAWSIRKLRTAWGGFLIAVRRSSDNAAVNVSPDSNGVVSLSSPVSGGGPPTLGAWLGANNGFITAYYDQSGNGNTASNATQAQQAQIATTGVINLINSRPAPLYSGTQFYSAADSVSLGLNTAMTAFFIARFTGFGAVSALMDKRITSGVMTGYHYYVAGNVFGMQWNSTIGGSTAVSPTLGTGTLMALTCRSTLGVSSTYYQNRAIIGTPQSFSSSGSSVNNVALLLGGHSSGNTSLYLQGYLPECFFINTSLVAETTMSAIVNDQRRFYSL
jgi:hypothetical protein